MPILSPQITRAARIETINVQMVGTVRAFLNDAYNQIMQDDPQVNLDALGDQAVDQLTKYGIFYSALVALGEVGDVAIPDPEIFVANADGTVTYTAPPEPEIEEEEELP